LTSRNIVPDRQEIFHLILCFFDEQQQFRPGKIYGGFIMAEKSNTGLLKMVLIIFAIVCLIYGLAYLFVPDALVKMSGGDPVFHGWLRWSGGILIALGIGSLLVSGKPAGQGIFITTIALGGLLAGLALLFAWITLEENANTWFTALPTIIVLGLTCLLWWSRQQAKDVLYPKTEQ
jgi:hypothetical protein